MTSIEIAALVEAGLQLAVKIVELVQAAQKGDVAAAETLKRMTEHVDSLKEAKDELHQYLDDKFDKP